MKAVALAALLVCALYCGYQFSVLLTSGREEPLTYASPPTEYRFHPDDPDDGGWNALRCWGGRLEVRDCGAQPLLWRCAR